MMAVALVGAVERDQETLACHGRQYECRPALPGQRVAQWCCEGARDRGPQHELAPIVVETGEHLVADVLPDQAVAAAEALESARSMRAQVDGGERERDRPSLGPREQGVDSVASDLVPSGSQQRGRLRPRHCQL